jgi:ornithine decarboxylase
MRHLRRVASSALRFVLEPGRYLIADHGAIRAHVVRLTARQQRAGARTHWLYLSCGKFNGMYEIDRLQYRLEFPTHPTGPTVDAVIAGPTCDSDDAYAPNHPVPVPIGLNSGDPVWVLSAGAYSISYLTVGFNGMTPLSHRTLPSRPLTEAGHP